MANLINIDLLLDLGFKIPNSDDIAVIEHINLIISNNEKLIVEAILGVSLTATFYSEYEADPATSRADKLWNGGVKDNIRFTGMKMAVANAIYFLILQEQVIYVSASGISSSTSENSGKVDPNPFMNHVFNEYVRVRNNTYIYMEERKDLWTEWDSQYFESIDMRSDYNF